MGIALVSLGGLASLICWIMVLVKMFKTQESPLMGIIGIVTCGLWAFIWGWMNAGKYAIKNIMLIWTVAIILSGVGNTMMVKASINAIQGMELKPTTIDMTPTEVAPVEPPAEEAAPE
jgi:hypothetical protein